MGVCVLKEKEMVVNQTMLNVAGRAVYFALGAVAMFALFAFGVL